jgi:hypothetical protein
MGICKEVVNILWEEDKDKPEVRKTINTARSCQVKKKKVEKNEEQIPEDYQSRCLIDTLKHGGVLKVSTQGTS